MAPKSSTVNISPSAQRRLSEITTSGGSDKRSTGCMVSFLVGRINDSASTIAHVIRIPDPDDDGCATISDDMGIDASDDGLDAFCDSSNVHYTGKRHFYSTPYLGQIDENWVLTTATQITRLLPGGLDLIGLALTLPSDKLKANVGKLRSLLVKLQDELVKKFTLPDLSFPSGQ